MFGVRFKSSIERDIKGVLTSLSQGDFVGHDEYNSLWKKMKTLLSEAIQYNSVHRRKIPVGSYYIKSYMYLHA